MGDKSFDTIAAISTAPGQSGIAVVRISGRNAMAVADKVFLGKRKLADCPGGVFVYGHVHEPDSEDVAKELDEAVALVYRAPHSYTREDVVEIQCHGGRISATRVLRAVLDAGARSAEPGEFTRRAFVNGRLDLTQAEAVMDIISAKSSRAAQAAIEQLDGRITNVITRCYDDILEAAADLEALLDVDEEDLLDVDAGRMRKNLASATSTLEELLRGWEEGHLLRDGALVIISGRPNAGKSTLLNSLIGKDRAIVSDQPGTTRDTIEEQLVLQGIPLRLVDTAGLRDSECSIERQGVERARVSIKTADILLHVMDASGEIHEDDRNILAQAGLDKCIAVLNKQDLGSSIPASHLKGIRCVECALKDNLGLEELKNAILDLLGITGTCSHATISERHKELVCHALNDLNKAANVLDPGEPGTFVLAATLLQSSMGFLGEITGRTYNDELLNTVFSRFCVGK